MKSRDGEGQWVLEGSKGGTDCESRDKENVRMVQATQKKTANRKHQSGRWRGSNIEEDQG